MAAFFLLMFSILFELSSTTTLPSEQSHTFSCKKIIKSIKEAHEKQTNNGVSNSDHSEPLIRQTEFVPDLCMLGLLRVVKLN